MATFGYVFEVVIFGLLVVFGWSVFDEARRNRLEPPTISEPPRRVVVIDTARNRPYDWQVDGL